MWNIVDVLLVAALCGCTSAVFVESGNPYEPGSLREHATSFILNPQDDDIPMQVRVDYPNVPDDYAVVLFMAGLNGLVPPLLYNDILTEIASHGFIVLTPFILNKQRGATVTDALHWLELNLGNYTAGPAAAWDRLGMTGHSSGAGEVMDLLLQDQDAALAVVMLDPSLLLLGGNATLPPLLPPAVFFGTNGSCNVPGIDYIAGFDAWTGPKVRTGNDNFGHCNFLDNIWLPVCKLVCREGNGPPGESPEFRDMIQGVVSGLYIHELQGREDAIEFVLDPDLYPFPPTDHDASLW